MEASHRRCGEARTCLRGVCECACVRMHVCACVCIPAWRGSVQLGTQFTQCFSWTKSQANKRKLHIMLNLFPNISDVLEQIHIFKISVQQNLLYFSIIYLTDSYSASWPQAFLLTCSLGFYVKFLSKIWSVASPLSSSQHGSVCVMVYRFPQSARHSK